MHPAKLVAAAVTLVASAAQAATFSARVVADDYYSVYVGDASGASMTLVGGSGPTLWQGQGAAFGFDAAAGQYIYVAAWDSASYGPPHMWIGEFSGNGSTLLSNKADWLGKYDASVKDPSTAQVSALAQSASAWSAPMVSMPNGSSPYGTLIGGSNALMVWHDTFDGSSASESGYALFRTLAPVVAVPEASTAVLLFAGLMLVGAAAARRR